jgi:uncharacterized protein DUF3179
MPCNSGVSLIPIVKGQQERFAARGLYNGLALLADYSTGSYWNHITGECVHGELVGTQLEFSDHDLIYTTVSSTLQSHPQALLARAQNNFGTSMRIWFMTHGLGFVRKLFGDSLPPHFVNTLDTNEDNRRERMDMGLGLWTDATHRYYPLETIQEQPNGFFDKVDGEQLFVYYNDEAKAPDAFYSSATQVEKVGASLCFDNGEQLKDGQLLNAQGEVQTVKRPQQIFARWYGFSYTFPNPEIYADGTSQ